MIKALTDAWNSPTLMTENSEGSWGWWIELKTAKPACLYYFGPFLSAAEAEKARQGYIDDLIEEGAEGFAVHVNWCKPQQLTYAESEPAELTLCV